MGFFEDIEQRIEFILASTPELDLGSLMKLDFSAKDRMKEENQDAANEFHDYTTLEGLLTAARGYELLGGHDVERAYALDRAAKALSEITGNDHNVDSMHIAYARLKQAAGELFWKVASSLGSHYQDAGFSFLRAAIAYAAAGDLEKAKKLARMHEDCFGEGWQDSETFRRARLLDIFTKKIYDRFGSQNPPAEIRLLYAEYREKAADLFVACSRRYEASFSYLRAAEAYALSGDTERARQMVEKYDSAAINAWEAVTKIKERVIALIECRGTP